MGADRRPRDRGGYSVPAALVVDGGMAAFPVARARRAFVPLRDTHSVNREAISAHAA